MSEERQRILTGVRPTGPLHLGHYVGALENWVRLQDGYECFFLLADYQVADYADRLDAIRSAIIDIALDWLAVGLDPSRSHFVVESQVPEHAELAQWLSWYLPLTRLQRNPTLKSELADLEQKTVPVAFFTYPILQAANILLPRAHLVPVGEDQLPHIEMTRELARRLKLVKAWSQQCIRATCSSSGHWAHGPCAFRWVHRSSQLPLLLWGAVVLSPCRSRIDGRWPERQLQTSRCLERNLK